MTEDELQAKCYKWFHNSFPELRKLLFAVPNGGSRHLLEAMKFKATGLIPGIPDLVFVLSGKAFFFELKTTHGKLSPQQTIVHSKIRNEKFAVYVIRSFEQFQETLKFIIMSVIEMKKLEKILGHQIIGLKRDEWEYEKKVFTLLFDLNPDVSVVVDKVAKPETRLQFVNTIKKFIDLKLDFCNGFSIIFNDTYTEFKKK